MDGSPRTRTAARYPNGGPYYYRLKSTVSIPLDAFGNPTAAGRTALYTVANWEAIAIPRGDDPGAAQPVAELRELVRVLPHAQHA